MQERTFALIEGRPLDGEPEAAGTEATEEAAAPAADADEWEDVVPQGTCQLPQ